MFAIGVALMKAFEFWPRARMLMKFAGRISTTRLTTKASPLLGVHNSLELAILFPNSSTSEFTRDNNHNYNPPPRVRLPSSLPTSRAPARAWPPSYHHQFSHQQSTLPWWSSLDNSHHLIASPSPLLGKILLLGAKFCLHLTSRETDEGPPEQLLEWHLVVMMRQLHLFLIIGIISCGDDETITLVVDYWNNIKWWWWDSCTCC